MTSRSIKQMAQAVALEEDVYLSPLPHEALAALINQLIATYQRNYAQDFPLGRTMAKVRKRVR